MKLLPSVVGAFSLWTIAAFAASGQDCKCIPGDDCWPTSSDWASLNNTIDGRLIRATPPAAVCYQNDPNYDTLACQAVLSNWTSSAFHAADPVSVDGPDAYHGCLPIFANGTSFLGETAAGQRGCHPEQYYPAYVINVTTDSHVQAGVRFAKKHNLRLNVKNTGHGRSATPNSLSIWTHHLKSMAFSEAWQPQGCKDNMTTPRAAMTFGAGVQDREAFEEAAKYDHVVVGGTDSTVGLVGWLSGGGHGYLTGSYGQGANNVLEATIVTPTGDVLVANENQNSDIFWAIRGGGPSFGVLTSLTVKAYPMPSTTMWSLVVDAKNGTTDAEFYKIVARDHSYLPALKTAGLQGYVTLSAGSLTHAFFAYNAPNGTVESAISPLLSYLQSQNSTVSTTSSIIWKSKWIDVYHMFNLTLAAGGGPGASSSRLLPAKSLTEDLEGLAATLQNVGPSMKPRSDGLPEPSISGTFSCGAEPVDSGLNPVWYDAVVHFLVSKAWDVNTPPEEAAAIKRNMTEVTGGALRKLAPDSGAYLNEADADEPDWQQSFFGVNYPRLLAIKQKYDPDGMMWRAQGVGSEGWYQDDEGRLCRRSKS